MTDKAFPILGALIFSVGLLLTFINFVLLLRKILRVMRANKTVGVVMNVEIREGMRQNYSVSGSVRTRNTLFQPTVRFQTADGQIVDYTPNTSNSWSNYKKGEQIPVYYDPQQPVNPVIGRPYNLWFPFFLFGMVSGIFAFVGGIFLLIGLTANF